MPTEIAASANGASVVANALKKASVTTGANFDFLAKMAMRESSMNPAAKAKTSSAAGLFQFIEQTWLSAVKAYGERHGLGEFANDIVAKPGGGFTVASAARRDEILNLRFDADKSAALAGELANENAAILKSRIGRAASSADLYLAHFLGPAGAAKMLKAGASTKAADLLPAAAKANRHVFYDGARAKTVGEVMASIAKSMGAAPTNGNAPVATHTALPAIASVQSSVISEHSVRVDHNTYTEQNIRNDRSRSSLAPALASPAPASNLSAIALSVLQALDPTRLASRARERD
ncbi:MAG: transglycosylase SLT domain-containing protein [Marinicaulis sp.]|nr:transglycosylase SLT domain-containing protein [Marinicaulis sp.]